MFDQTDPKNLGRPLYFNLQAHIAAVESLIRSDEIMLALKLLDMVPAWYRDNYPPELEELKRKIYEQTYDQIEYATDTEEAECTREFGEAQWTNGYMFPRAEIIANIVREYNQNSCIPWIFDLGCSHGNLPLGLMQERLKFYYKGVGLNGRIVQKVKEWVGEHGCEEPPKPASFPKILYCTEVLEHCFNPHDIVHTAAKVGVDWDVVLLSVPKYTMGGGLPDWDTRRLGHVRTWTPAEFIDFASKTWRGRKWQLVDAFSMVLVGRK